MRKCGVPRPACKCPYHSGQAPLKLQYCPFQVQGFQSKSTLQQTPQVKWPAGHLGPAAENHIQHGAVLGTPVSSSYTRRDADLPEWGPRAPQCHDRWRVVRMWLKIILNGIRPKHILIIFLNVSCSSGYILVAKLSSTPFPFLRHQTYPCLFQITYFRRSGVYRKNISFCYYVTWYPVFNPEGKYCKSPRHYLCALNCVMPRT